MGRQMIFDDIYYADQAHEEAPWLIRNGEHRVVGHYAEGRGVNWGAMMADGDKEWLADLIQQKIGGAGRKDAIVSHAAQKASSQP